MNLPIQAAPIDRANRAINMQGAARSGVISPAQFSIKSVCPLCDLLPPPIGPICKIICGQLG